MNNKVRILRELEYINGGLITLCAIFKDDKENNRYFTLFDDWHTVLCDIVDMVEEEDD